MGPFFLLIYYESSVQRGVGCGRLRSQTASHWMGFHAMTVLVVISVCREKAFAERNF